MNILLVDDEVEIIELIELYLTKEDYTVYKAGDGLEALNIIKKTPINMVVVDIMMPNMNGLSLIKRIRETMNIPIIIISARDAFSDKVLGLDIGADDYVVKPFNPLELLARIKAQLRRYEKLGGSAEKEQKSIINHGELEINRDECTLRKNKQPIELTVTEFKILECLFQQPGRVFTKSQVYEYAWGEDYYGDENVLRIHISNLREKIEADSKKPVYIKTVRGLGYKVEKV